MGKLNINKLKKEKWVSYTYKGDQWYASIDTNLNGMASIEVSSDDYPVQERVITDSISNKRISAIIINLTDKILDKYFWGKQ